MISLATLLRWVEKEKGSRLTKSEATLIIATYERYAKKK